MQRQHDQPYERLQKQIDKVVKDSDNDKKLGKEIVLQDGGVIKLQSNLGGLTDEIKKTPGMITQFVGLAPKMYSYEITTPEGKT